MAFDILTINPGSTSTKVAWFADENEIWRENLNHPSDVVSAFSSVAAQYEFRMKAIDELVASKGMSIDSLSAVVGRGGLVDPIPSGTYGVNDALLMDLRRGKPWEHASNLGGIIAFELAKQAGPNVPSFIVDPVSVDEMDDVARVTGLPELPKISLAHALNVKATVRRASKDMGKKQDEMNFVVAHLGGGITVCAHRKGKMADLNNANEFGPMSPERAGGVPAGDLVKLCYSGQYTLPQVRKMLVGEGGCVGYLGTNDIREVRRRIDNGDEKAKLVFDAMVYQVAKEIGAYSTAMCGKVDAILLTGGIAYSVEFVEAVRAMTQWIAPVLVYPGEDEMRALAEGALLVLRGEEKARTYKG